MNMNKSCELPSRLASGGAGSVDREHRAWRWQGYVRRLSHARLRSKHGSPDADTGV